MCQDAFGKNKKKADCKFNCRIVVLNFAPHAAASYMSFAVL